MPLIFLCTENIAAMKRLDWKPKRIKYKSSHLILPFGNHVFLLSLPYSAQGQHLF